MRLKEKFNRKLLLEGNDDQHVIWALCEKFGINENFDVIDCEGVANLLAQIPIRFKQSGIEIVGIIIDADINISERWVTISGLLSSSGYVCPIAIPTEGLILNQDGKIRVGVWIMPNNNLDGMLEDFIAFMVPQNDNLLPVVTSTLLGIEAAGINRYSMLHKSKATVHSWLALQEDPGTPMGLSITKRYLTTDTGYSNIFSKWLQNLFV
jgi:hypothetical protein